jgi:hypothetical protein
MKCGKLCGLLFVKFSKEQVTTIWKKLGKEVAINEKVQTLRSVLSEHELINIIQTASSNCREQKIKKKNNYYCTKK